MHLYISEKYAAYIFIYNINYMNINIYMSIFFKICFYVFIHIINIHSTHIQQKLILDVINHD